MKHMPEKDRELATKRHKRHKIILILLYLLCLFVANSFSASVVTLPIEVVGENGTISSATVDVPALHAFAGEDLEEAVFFPEDDRFLVDRELRVAHYEVEERGR